MSHNTQPPQSEEPQASRKNWSKQEDSDLVLLVGTYYPQETWVQIALRHGNLGHDRNADQCRNHWRRYSRKLSAVDQEDVVEEHSVKEEELNGDVDGRGVDDNMAVMPMPVSIAQSRNSSQNTNIKRSSQNIDMESHTHTASLASHKKTKRSRFSSTSPPSSPTLFPQTRNEITPILTRLKNHEIPTTLQQLTSTIQSNQDQDAQLQDLDEQLEKMESEMLELTRQRRKAVVAREEGHVAVEKLERELVKQREEIASLEHAIVILEERGVGEID